MGIGICPSCKERHKLHTTIVMEIGEIAHIVTVENPSCEECLETVLLKAKKQREKELENDSKKELG